jgi:hypothetical protein
MGWYEWIDLAQDRYHWRALVNDDELSGYVNCCEGMRPVGRYRRRWEDNIKMDIRGKRCGGMDWIHLTQDRDQWRALVKTVMNLRVP